MDEDNGYLYLIQQGEVYAPEYLGKKDVLIAGGTIAAVEDRIDLSGDVQVIDASGKLVLPGFIDNHVHLIGGGGEGGFRTRTPEIQFSEIVQAGVTTAVGCLGTDGITRNLSDLLAKARALEEEGITTYIYTGSYQVPVLTLTDSIQKDIIFVDKIIGVGEVAISDHRSSQPTYNDILKIVSEAYVAGLLSGKAGLVMFHVGKGSWNIRTLQDILANTDIPARQLLPTHMDRTPELLKAALEYIRPGGFVDLTTSTPSLLPNGKQGSTAASFLYLLEQGAPATHILFSSDAQGSIPNFNDEGQLVGLSVGKIQTLWETVRELVTRHQVSPEIALLPVTSNPATLLRLSRKGRLEAGKDADLLLINAEDFSLDTVFARGRILMQQSKLRVRGTFETE